MSSSPLVVGQTVIVQSESQGEAFVAGIDTADGTTRWQLDRERTAIWTSPALLRERSGTTAVLVQSTKSISAIDPATRRGAVDPRTRVRHDLVGLRGTPGSSSCRARG